jgi:pSer/pThr/pTyr-binding forkhead associated (FHA) protein
MDSNFVTLVMRNGDRVQKFVSKGEKRLTVGRARDCDIRMPDGLTNADVSRHHCLFAIKPPEIRLCDLGSRNGTFVNGMRIDAKDRTSQLADPCISSEIALKDGDEVRVGGTTFQILVDHSDEETTREMTAH